MPDTTPPSPPSPPASEGTARASGTAEAVVAVAALGLLALLVVPISSHLLDALMIVNIGIGLVLLVRTTTIRSSLELSAFPGILLLVTLYRLCLNVASARLVLSQGPEFDGQVIRAFGGYVCGDNPLLGLVVFSILVVVQVLVITRGSERIAEVSARFHLEALPPQLMSIDAELAGGRITPGEASRRRERLERSSEFCGSMDGACKFLKGETVAGIVIVLVNLLGGSIAGVLRGGAFLSSAATYATLSIGDGLAQMMPAIATSLAAGMLITKAQTAESFSEGAAKELLQQRGPLKLVATLLGAALLLLGFTGGGVQPWPIFLAMVLFAIAYHFHQSVPVAPPQPAPGADDLTDQDAPTPHTAHYHPPIEIALAPDLAATLDTAGPDALVAAIKKGLWEAWGMPTPLCVARTSASEPPGAYTLRSGGVEIARGLLKPGHTLWLLTTSDAPDAVERSALDPRPTWSRPGPAVWIPDGRDLFPQGVAAAGRDILISHLSDVLVDHAEEVVGIDEVRWALDGLRTHYPAALAEAERTNLPLPLLAAVLAGLIRERVSVRNLPRVLAILCARRPQHTDDPQPLIEAVRVALAGAICRPLADQAGVVRALLIDPGLETRLARVVETTGRMAIEPALARPLLREIAKSAQRLRQAGVPPALAVQARVRPDLKRLTAKAVPDLAVIAFPEVPAKLQLLSAGIVGRTLARQAALTPAREAQDENAQEMQAESDAEPD